MDPPLPERAQRRRIEALERRLARLSLSPPLRRALAGTLALLRDPGTRPAAMALQQLTAPVRETLGVEAAEVIAKGGAQAAAGLRSSATIFGGASGLNVAAGAGSLPVAMASLSLGA